MSTRVFPADLNELVIIVDGKSYNIVCYNAIDAGDLSSADKAVRAEAKAAAREHGQDVKRRVEETLSKAYEQGTKYTVIKEVAQIARLSGRLAVDAYCAPLSLGAASDLLVRTSGQDKTQATLAVKVAKGPVGASQASKKLGKAPEKRAAKDVPVRC